jgi:hypothetical protein
VRARAPRRKPTGKAKKPPAVTPPVGNATATEGILSGTANALPKWAEAILAQKDGLPDPDSASPPTLLSDFQRQLEFSRLESHEARRLLEELEKTAQELSRLSAPALETIDSIKLRSVILGCFDILEKNSRVGGEKAKEAIDILVNVIHRGCAKLAGAATHEKSEEVLKTCASMQPKWPVMLSLKESSYQEAKNYLDQIGVGTASTPPTAKTRIDATNKWTKFAVKLIHKIINSRNTLEMQIRKEQSLSRLLLGGREEEDEFFEAMLVEARRWKQVLDVPPELNNKSWKEWWAVAEAMLEAAWEANPTERNELFKGVEKSAKSLIRTKKKNSEALARSLETESKNLIVKSIREAFRAIAAKRKPA